ncbi:hypothetical protein TNCV_94161 [Trichonephila clavipes]|nr:hypothetical protein TNCV_94161 [Trichonephila clavipes]
MLAVHNTAGGTNSCGFQSSVNNAMDALRVFHLAANVKEYHNKRNRRGLNLVNELAMNLNYGVQSTFRDIPCPNTPV